MTIARILRGKGSHVFSVGPGDDAISVAHALAQHRIGAALVRDNAGAILGIVSERDIVRALAHDGATALAQTARQLMTTELHTVSPETHIADAMSMMTDRRCRHLPVLDGKGALLGMVSIGDLVKARIEDAESEAENLRAFVTNA
jgi:CBS domain-containing protein